MSETFELSLEQAWEYERGFVPALFAQWVEPLLDSADVGVGDRVLDVACGTGVVARGAADRVGGEGRVTGVDLNPAMLEVAGQLRPDIEWRTADAADLPYPEGTFDVVLCASAVFFFPDRARAFREMVRVAAPGGRVAVQTYAALDRQPGYGPFVDLVTTHAGEGARAQLERYWSAGDVGELTELLTAAGARDVRSSDRLGVVRMPSVADLVRTEIRATPLAAEVDDQLMERIVREARGLLSEHVQGDHLELPVRAVFMSAGR